MGHSYHWTPAQMRAFLETLAATGSVAQAARDSGKDRRSAYRLRTRPDGAAFRLGWEAAIIEARFVIEDALLERAIIGQEVTTVKSEDGRSVSKFSHDAKLTFGLLERLDRLADTNLGSPAALVARDFWAFLNLVEAGGTAEDVAAFIETARAGQPHAQCDLPQKSGSSTSQHYDESSSHPHADPARHERDEGGDLAETDREPHEAMIDPETAPAASPAPTLWPALTRNQRRVAKKMLARR